MSDYSATIEWNRNNENFLSNEYSRTHQWKFDGGLIVPASASPHIVPLPWSCEENVDPEEAFVAALSSCHMLFFLSFAAKKQFIVDRYIDNAVGELGKNVQGKVAMTKVTLNPQISFSSQVPTNEELDQLHHRAHRSCFIANSVNCKIVINQI